MWCDIRVCHSSTLETIALYPTGWNHVHDTPHPFIDLTKNSRTYWLLREFLSLLYIYYCKYLDECLDLITILEIFKIVVIRMSWKNSEKGVENEYSRQYISSSQILGCEGLQVNKDRKSTGSHIVIWQQHNSRESRPLHHPVSTTSKLIISSTKWMNYSF